MDMAEIFPRTGFLNHELNAYHFLKSLIYSKQLPVLKWQLTVYLEKVYKEKSFFS